MSGGDIETTITGALSNIQNPVNLTQLKRGEKRKVGLRTSSQIGGSSQSPSLGLAVVPSSPMSARTTPSPPSTFSSSSATSTTPTSFSPLLTPQKDPSSPVVNHQQSPLLSPLLSPFPSLSSFPLSLAPTTARGKKPLKSKLYSLLFEVDERESCLPLSSSFLGSVCLEEWYKVFVKRFNSHNPVKAVRELVEKGEMKSPCDIARLLFGKSTDFDSSKVGEYLSDAGKFENSVLRMYLRYIDFTSEIEFDVALRKTLRLFRLPGEAQKIDRIMKGFANYFSSLSSDPMFSDCDSVYLLAFSAVMLNTDAHNANVDHKMSMAQFVLNMDNALLEMKKQTFPKEFLEDLYRRIIKQEISMNITD